MSDAVTNQISKSFHELIKVSVQGIMLWDQNKKKIQEWLRKKLSPTPADKLVEGQYELQKIDDNQVDLQDRLKEVNELLAARAGEAKEEISNMYADGATPSQTQYAAAAVVSGAMEQNERLTTSEREEFGQLKDRALKDGGFESVEDAIEHLDNEDIVDSRGMLDAIKGEKEVVVDEEAEQVEKGRELTDAEKQEDLLDMEEQEEDLGEGAPVSSTGGTHTEVAGAVADPMSIGGGIGQDGQLVAVPDSTEMSVVAQEQITEKGDPVVPPKQIVGQSLDGPAAADSMNQAQTQGQAESLTGDAQAEVPAAMLPG
jgi:hypothetical protein